MREKLRSNTASIDKIPPTIEEMEESEQLDLVDLQRLILKDKELGASKGFEDEEDDDDDNLDFESDKLKAMMAARFGHNRVREQ